MRVEQYSTFKKIMKDPAVFARRFSGVTLRRYQVEVARRIVSSVLRADGLSFVVMFPRQSGKNELQAQIETYLLALFSQRDAEIVKVSPTWKPQSLNAMRRLERVLERNLVVRDLWQKEAGYIYRVGKARIFFLSGGPEANIVGATASTLLEVDEAQDVLIAKFDKDIAPMAASTNATRVFWGTAWTSQTLLARELRAARLAEQQDGIRRAFVLTADEVAREVPAYGDFVASQTARLGRSHPLVRTQFYSEEIDGAGGMFPPERIGLMRGAHAWREQPASGAVYALLLDIAGEDESLQMNLLEGLSNPARDATALTIVEVGLEGLADERLRAPLYRVVQRRLWTGTRHTRLFSEIKALAEQWRARYLVVDATGVGAGLASFLEKALPGRVIPFTFQAASKSQLGWDFLTLVDSGRWQEYSPSLNGAGAALQTLFEEQLGYCQYEILSGPDRRMKWGVPDGQRNASGEFVHDDLVLSAALAAVLDRCQWSSNAPALVVPSRDPLRDIDRQGF